MKGYIIHEHGLSIRHQNSARFNQLSQFKPYDKDQLINLQENDIYEFYCTICKRYSLNYDNHDNFNYYYMVNPPESNSNCVKFQDNFNIGYILLGNEIERENYIYNYFIEGVERLKNFNINLTNEKSALNEKIEQILKNQNLLEKEKSRLSIEIERLKNFNKNLVNEKSYLNVQKEQILKNKNLLEKEKSRLSIEIERLKNDNINLTNEKSALNEKIEQILKNKNLLEKEKSRLSIEIERLKNDNINLTNEKSSLKEQKEQILKKKNLLEEEKSRLSQEIKTLNDNNDKNEKNFQEQINELNNEIEKKKRRNKRFRIKI